MKVFQFVSKLISVSAKLVTGLLGCIGICVVIWVYFSNWPESASTSLRWKPDAILILGGGNGERVVQGLRLANQFPRIPVVVTGDDGLIVRELLENGLRSERLIHEEYANSTMENAVLTKGILESCGAQKVILVTNWFHGPRSLAVFRSQNPALEFAVISESKPDPIGPWDRDAQRRERIASLYYFFRYGVWSW